MARNDWQGKAVLAWLVSVASVSCCGQLPISDVWGPRQPSIKQMPENSSPKRQNRAEGGQEGGGKRPILTAQLPGFAVGEYTHPAAHIFLGNLANQLRISHQTGKPAYRVTVRGFADGLKNTDGVDFRLESIPQRCRSGIAHAARLRDPDLAYLRACIVLDGLSTIISKTVGVAAWDTTVYDIPDFGPSGAPYRKVVVDVTDNTVQPPLTPQISIRAKEGTL